MSDYPRSLCLLTLMLSQVFKGRVIIFAISHGMIDNPGRGAEVAYNPIETSPTSIPRKTLFEATDSSQDRNHEARTNGGDIFLLKVLEIPLVAALRFPNDAFGIP